MTGRLWDQGYWRQNHLVCGTLCMCPRLYLFLWFFKQIILLYTISTKYLQLNEFGCLQQISSDGHGKRVNHQSHKTECTVLLPIPPRICVATVFEINNRFSTILHDTTFCTISLNVPFNSMHWLWTQRICPERCAGDLWQIQRKCERTQRSPWEATCLKSDYRSFRTQECVEHLVLSQMEPCSTWICMCLQKIVWTFQINIKSHQHHWHCMLNMHLWTFSMCEKVVLTSNATVTNLCLLLNFILCHWHLFLCTKCPVIWKWLVLLFWMSHVKTMKQIKYLLQESISKVLQDASGHEQSSQPIINY